jgi:crotonobetainyl-CoA:carnitine CoA-transferase CaiB-like acyl-CoA transferase
MHAEIGKTFADMTTAELIHKLEAADIANARLNTMQQFWQHPQLVARGRWSKVGSPAGDIDMLKPPTNIDGMEPRMGPVPAVGEHSRAILEELGYSASEVAHLQAEKAV